MRAHAGEAVFVPGNTPMELNVVGATKREALFIVVHDPSHPWSKIVHWRPQGLCKA